MKFELNKLYVYLQSENWENMKSLAYTYISNITYLAEEEYNELVVMLKAVTEIVYEVKEKEVQEVLFDVMRNGINCHFGKCSMLNECIDLLIDKIKSTNMTQWELAESLQVIAASMDKKYSSFMQCFKECDDEYIQEVVAEYFYDIGVKDR